MKIQKLLVSLGILLVPFIAGATAYNDATLTVGTVINFGGHDFSVSGDQAVVQSITVNASNISFILDSSSSINISSSEGIILSTDADGAYIVSNGCKDGVFTLKHASKEADSVTVVVTLEGSTCPSTTVAPESGGGSGHRSNAVAATTVTSVPATVVPTSSVIASQASFARRLAVGSTGDDVKNLQARLLSEGFFKGEVTGYFGPITQVAVKAYQAKYGIDQLGFVGPATRAQLNKLFMANPVSNASATTGLAPAQVSTITAQINALLKQVQELQAKLKAQSN
jgi:hypothetical protein